MSESDIERAARAMYDAWDDEGAGHRTGWINLPEREKASYIRVARRTIAAIREPSEAMYEAGAEKLYGHPRHKAEEWAKVDKYECQGDIAAEGYRAMIDAALKD